MVEMHLKHPRFTYSACGQFTKNLERREIGNLKHLYRNKLDKACFAHDAALSDSKDLAKRTTSRKEFKKRLWKKSKEEILKMMNIKSISKYGL